MSPTPLGKGTYGATYVVRDSATKRLLCLKAFNKTEAKRDGLDKSMLQELKAYKLIAEKRGTDQEQNGFLMELHGVFQDETRVFYAMVCRYSLFSLFPPANDNS